MDKQHKKISVILPVYNAEKYLKKCLDSIVNQSLKDIEIICVNDGSNDGSLEIMNEYAKKDDRIFLINQENEGPSVARNAALAVATGEFIGFVDADDWIEPSMFETLYNKAREDNSEIVFCDYKEIYNNESEKAEKQICCNFPKKPFVWQDVRNYLLFEGSYIWHQIYKKELFEDILFPKYLPLADNPVFLELMVKSKRCSYVEEYFYNYTVQIDSMCRGENKNTVGIYGIIDAVQAILDSYKLSELLHSNMQFFKQTRIYWLFCRTPKSHKKEYLKKAKEYLSKVDYWKLLLTDIFPKINLLKYVNKKWYNKTNKYFMEKIYGIRMKIKSINHGPKI